MNHKPRPALAVTQQSIEALKELQANSAELTRITNAVAKNPREISNELITLRRIIPALAAEYSSEVHDVILALPFFPEGIMRALITKTAFIQEGYLMDTRPFAIGSEETEMSVPEEGSYRGIKSYDKTEVPDVFVPTSFTIKTATFTPTTITDDKGVTKTVNLSDVDSRESWVTQAKKVLFTQVGRLSGSLETSLRNCTIDLSFDNNYLLREKVVEDFTETHYTDRPLGIYHFPESNVANKGAKIELKIKTPKSTPNQTDNILIRTMVKGYFVKIKVASK